jgi:hypothetical protein
LSGINENIRNIKNSALAGDDLEKRKAIEMMGNQTLPLDEIWETILALAEIGKASSWPEPKNLALEVIIRLICEALLEQ